MKLPEFHKIGVQSLGREGRAAVDALNASANANRAESDKWYAYGDTALSVAAFAFEEKDKHDVMKAESHLKTTMDDFEAENKGKQYFSVDDPALEGINYDTKDEFGNDRMEIPAHEVYSQMYEAKINKTFSEAQGMVGRFGSRDKFTHQYEKQVSGSIAQAKIQGAVDQHNYMVKQQDDMIADYIDRGMWSAAGEAVNGENYIGSPESRKRYNTRIAVGQEDERVAKEMSMGTPESMRALASEMRSSKYDGGYSKEKAYETARRLDEAAKSKDDYNATQVGYENVQSMVESGLTYGEMMQLANSQKNAKVAQAMRSEINQRKQIEESTSSGGR